MKKLHKQAKKLHKTVLIHSVLQNICIDVSYNNPPMQKGGYLYRKVAFCMAENQQLTEVKKKSMQLSCNLLNTNTPKQNGIFL